MLYDKDIREPLFEFLETTYGKIRILEEKNMGASRADVVMVLPEAVCGIEIKSDADTYARLERQVTDYDLFFDYNYIVAGTSHAQHVREHVPEWWGIITVEEEAQKVDFYILRQPQPNPKRSMTKKLGLLWRPELAHIQELNGTPKYNQKSKLFVAEYLAEHVDERRLQGQISEELFERDYSTIHETINAFREENGQKPRRKKRVRRRRRKG